MALNYNKLLKWILSLLLIIVWNQGSAQKKDHIITIKTRFGDMVAVLYDATPKHKSNFITLAKEGFYDSLLFHRIIGGFMIQGGDPQSRNSKPGSPLGNGGPGYTIDSEINPEYFHRKGALSAARLADQVNPAKASSGSQFYIVQGKKFNEHELKTDPQKFQSALRKFLELHKNYRDSIAAFYRMNDRAGYENYLKKLKPVVEQKLGIRTDEKIRPEIIKAYTEEGGAPHLDGQYTVFGQVIKGLDVIDKIASQPRDRADRPVDNITMVIIVRELKKKKIEKMYGYKYPVQKK